jgi:hypothetical protein
VTILMTYLYDGWFLFDSIELYTIKKYDEYIC